MILKLGLMLHLILMGQVLQVELIIIKFLRNILKLPRNLLVEVLLVFLIVLTPVNIVLFFTLVTTVLTVVALISIYVLVLLLLIIRFVILYLILELPISEILI